MSLPKFITSRTFLIQLILAAVLLIVLLFAAMKGLEKYTRHGQSEPVPDFTGMFPAEAKKIALHSHLRIEVADSVYLDNAAPGTVVDQVPRPGHGVKQKPNHLPHYQFCSSGNGYYSKINGYFASSGAGTH